MSDLKQLLQNNGVVGAGGAGFPSYCKLAEGADTLLINAVECEPLLYTSYTLLQERIRDIVIGMRAVMEYVHIPRGLIAVKDYRAAKLGYSDGQELAPGVFIKYIPNIYPMGDEINLIYTATGRVVPPGQLPITRGVIVYNTETIYNIGLVVQFGQPVTKTYLTISGDIPKAYCVKVPVGMRISEVLKIMNVQVPDTHVVIDGGPSMGTIVNLSTDVVKKPCSGLLILPKTIPAVRNKLRTMEENFRRAASVCCQCSRCTDLCPRHLLGYPLEPHKMVRSTLSAAQADPELIKSATMCCGCDICSTLACCQEISPMQVIKEYKNILAKNRIKYVANPNEQFTPSPEREARMVSAGKWKEMLGVAQYDKFPPIYVEEKLKATEVQVPMSQHIGAPAIPIVKVGDEVVENQMIAKAAEGLSVPHYAPITGKVTYVDGKTIVIHV
ncbi:MAG: NADH-quinone oxidoreductase subunit J [Ruminococcaceae bacterium]|nr:NADH-quinone oxidoreductase subunit J [Oscillospiraceae bacterium]